jgi:NAD(P)-dependent dehydrogenase (short-subunit alcohol dehydrogenase family)
LGLGCGRFYGGGDFICYKGTIIPEYALILRNTCSNNENINMSDLNNKVAVITGGNSGIGFSTAQEFIQRGAQVLITGRREDAVAAAVAELGPQAQGFRADAASLADSEALAAAAKALYGQVDILFINAGVASFAPIAFVDEAHFDTMMDINFKGAYFTLQKFLPLLSDGASVIFLSSINASMGMPNASVYCASKAAMNALAKVAANELSSRKIRVNIVSPGPVDTPLFGKTGMTPEMMAGFAESLQARLPLGRFGKPEEIAKLAAYLASDDSAWVTGQEFVIDGGALATSPLG